MFRAGIFIGLYSYAIFFAGITGLLSQAYIAYLTTLYWGIFIFVIRNNLSAFFKNIKSINIKSNKFFIFFLVLIITQATINFVGVIGPELAFDALWYHLTIPKIWLENGRIFYIPGGLLYYSAMPKLAEMLYIAGLAIGAETAVKIIHFTFGILTTSAIYLLTKNIFNRPAAIAAAAIFYANPVIAWESITAYVDLTRAFYEILAFWALILWSEKHSMKWLILSAVFLGLAITTKLLAIGSILIFSILIIVVILNYDKSGSLFERLFKRFRLIIRSLMIFIFTALLIPVPWLLFAFLNTGNALFPFFTDIYPVNPTSLSILDFVIRVYNLFLYSADPLSPVYLVFLPILLMFFKFFDFRARLVMLYSVLAVIIWYFTPQTGGGRFIAAYLPVLSIAAAGCVYVISIKSQALRNHILRAAIFGTIITASFICIIYRGGANFKYLPVIIGVQSKSDFLEKNLNFSFGDFYDIDGYFAKNIKAEDMVLLIGFHNLYYVDFSFVHETWLNRNHKFNYIATQNANLPAKYKNFKLIYRIEKTDVNLYKID